MEYPHTEEIGICSVDRECSTGTLTTLFHSWWVVVYVLDFRCIFPLYFFSLLRYYFAMLLSRSFDFSLHFLQVFLFTRFSHRTHVFLAFFPFRYLGVCFYQPFTSLSLHMASQLQYVQCFLISENIRLLRRQILFLLKHQFQM